MNIELKLWKIWFKFTKKLVIFSSKRNVINHSNYSPMYNRLFNWAYRKNQYAHAKIHDLECHCGYSQVKHLLEIREILNS